MKSRIKKLLFLSMFLFPTIVLAKGSSEAPGLPMILFVEAFVTIHMTVFFHIPLSNLLVAAGVGTDQKKVLKTLIIGRIVILLIGNLVLKEVMMAIDFLTVFIGAFVIVPIYSAANKRKGIYTDLYGSSVQSASAPISSGVRIIKDSITAANIANRITAREINEDNWYETTAYLAKDKKTSFKECYSCHELNALDNSFCTKCGTKLDDNTALANPGYCPKCRAKLNPGVKYCVNCGIELGSYVVDGSTMEAPSEGQVDVFFNQTEAMILDSIITKELEENHYDKNMVIPGLRKRKLLLSFIFALVTFIALCLVFFHLPLLYYGVYVVLFIVYLINIKSYDIKKYIIKQIKARPDEKINNVVASVVASAVKKSFGFEYVAMFLVAILLPLSIFSKPRIFYEKVDDGYAMRFYAFGWSEMDRVEIPDEYNGEPVVSLRGNAFSNMYFLKEVKLPNTITEIRGQAFKNDIMLEKVNMPDKLEYLGGGSFYNCINLEEIELPDTLTTMGGETFYGAQKLKKVKLSDNLTEIRGNTFQDCISLQEITIPASVTRIGAHAFHGDSNLASVTIPYDSKLTEIGSSGFRDCYKLASITLPSNTTYATNAFKGSGTNVKRFTKGPDGNIISFDKVETVSFYENSEYSYYDSKRIYHTLKFEGAHKNGSKIVYDFEYYTDNGYSKKITLYSTDKSMFITDKLYVEIVYAYTNSVTLSVSYKK